MKEKFVFEKFMHDILKKEEADIVKDDHHDASPQRNFIKRYSERWQNRIVWQGNKK